ncbi:MAG: GAF domain-containing protein [Candidatus Nitronauta litoralis]|uniref:GAF domain-containing protein n=1 Tax=Candidatus Nitronauta litoralis TaxID=2705533 RepID=A0A7T0BSY4_9BACT|nr:MAG: GAF domain-containing protein [Candidatus Nitronauta litoralis]
MNLISEKFQKNSNLLPLLSLGTAGFVLFIDWVSPLGISDGVLYVALVLLGLLTGKRKYILIEATAGTVLCIFGIFISPSGGELWKVLLNRFLAIIAIWLTAMLCLLQQRTQQKLQNAHKALEENVRIRTQELHQAHEKLIREKSFLELNKNLTAVANISGSVEGTIQFALDQLCRHTDWPVGHLYIVEEGKKDHLISSNIWHFSEEEAFLNFKRITESTSFEPGVGLPGRVLESGKPAWITDATLDENFPRAHLDNNIGIRAGFAFPVLIGKEVVGVMEFFSTRAVEPQTEMLEVMSQAGIHLGRAIERQRAEIHQEKLLSILKERIKELTCLYQVSHLIGTSKSLEMIFNKLEANIKPGWQYPEATRVKVRFDNQTYGSPLFEGSPWMISAPIFVSGIQRGTLEVFYSKEKPQTHEGPFLKEERHLIETLANLLGIAAERITAEKNILKSEDQLRNLYHRLQNIREEERSRIAREFHDQLGQVLTTLKLELDLLDKKLHRIAPALRENTQRLLELVDGTLPAVKQLVMDLRPPVLDDLGLQDAIEWQAQDFEKRTGIDCIVQVHNLPKLLTPEQATALFRIFQETLTNIVRHAQASQVSVCLKQVNGHVILKVADNGKGIKSSKISDSKSLGILGMKERVLPWGGKVDIQGEENKGTTVTIQIHTETT